MYKLVLDFMWRYFILAFFYLLDACTYFTFFIPNFFRTTMMSQAPEGDDMEASSTQPSSSQPSSSQPSLSQSPKKEERVWRLRDATMEVASCGKKNGNDQFMTLDLLFQLDGEPTQRVVGKFYGVVWSCLLVVSHQ